MLSTEEKLDEIDAELEHSPDNHRKNVQHLLLSG
jgi:hypothetical protein